MARLSFLQNPRNSIFLITIAAGVVYSSWPLGYWLNPVASRGLASNLEASRQPYNWLFISLDILSGSLICLASWWLYRIVRRAHIPLLIYTLFGFAAFGLLTAVDAMLPLNCINVINRCGSVFDDPWYVFHGIASIGSIVGLTVSIVCLWWLLARDKSTSRYLRWFLHSTIAIWAGFSIVTLALILLARSSNLSQHIFITVCTLWTAFLPLLVYQAMELEGLISTNHGTVKDMSSSSARAAKRSKPKTTSVSKS